MSMFKRLLCLVLCLCLTASLFGCNKPVQTDPDDTAPSQTEPTLPPALSAYTQARAAVDNAQSLSLRVTLSKSTSVGGEVFTEKTSQTLQKTLDEAGNVLWSSQETVDYAANGSTSNPTITFNEVYSGGTLYVTMDDSYLFSGSVTAEEYAQRVVPAVLLDGALYGQVTQDGSTLRFSEPTAPESWAIPEGAELVEASGTALLSSSGELEKTTYTITYTYGSAEITLEAEVYVTLEPVTVQLPEDPSLYTALEYVDAPRMAASALNNLFNAQTVSLGSLESVMSQAAGFIHNQSKLVNTWGTGSDFHAKVENGSFLMDSTGEQEYDLEETFVNGVYTMIENGGEPQTLSHVTNEMMEEYCLGFLSGGMVSYEYWQTATVTDLGSLYLLELTFNDDLAQLMQETICTTYFGDAELLNDLASDYRTNTLTGYFSIDKYTGLPTAAGYQYEGVHTIQGQECILSHQADKSIEAPALGAYYTITEEMLPEEEPENKATPLFYHVTGPEGQEMWLFGTIHVGDERTAYLPQEIYDALASSDALALEFYSERFDQQCEDDEALQDAISDAYYYSDGTMTSDHTDPEIYEDALRYLKAIGGYNMNSEYMKPYLWSQQIDNFHLRQSYLLTSDQGVESRLEAFAEANDIEIRDVESGLFQIQMVTGWSDELQSLLLEDCLTTDPLVNWEGTMELYELWCAGDEAAMREELSTDVDTSEFTEEELAEYQEQKPYIDEYNQSMSFDRNDGMLEVAIEYLESGETVFYAVGLAHLLDNHNGLVDTLRAAGYTVELVEFAE